MKRAVIFDLDGTVMNPEHRLNHIKEKPKRWDLFHEGIINDVPHQDVVEILMMYWESGYDIILATGRPEEFREATILSLGKHYIPFTSLYMRKDNDFRHDDIVKEEMIEQMRNDNFEPYVVFEDRNRVVDMWRRNGIRCFHVAPGDF